MRRRPTPANADPHRDNSPRKSLAKHGCTRIHGQMRTETQTPCKRREHDTEAFQNTPTDIFTPMIPHEANDLSISQSLYPCYRDLLVVVPLPNIHRPPHPILSGTGRHAMPHTIRDSVSDPLGVARSIVGTTLAQTPDAKRPSPTEAKRSHPNMYRVPADTSSEGASPLKQSICSNTLFFRL